MKCVLWQIFLVMILIVACGENPDVEEKELFCSSKIYVVNWNVQTFFDGENDGSEYSEFVQSKSWGREMYVQRLKRLCECIKKIDADVFVMEELENENVLCDIYNFLCGEWNCKKLYSYGAFGKNEGSSIGIGVLSRLPLGNLKVHGLEVLSEESHPRLRPVVEFEVSCNGKILTVFANHWKSKSGGEEVTEKWRNWEEAVLSFCVDDAVEKGKAVVCTGDFNRDINDFSFSDGNKVCLRKRKSGCFKDGVSVESGWFLKNGSLVEPGSYYFQESWERIDNFFCAGSAKIFSCGPETEGNWCNADSFIPERFELWNGDGYSDHLPIGCIVEF